jgi:hypothetical protein
MSATVAPLTMAPTRINYSKHYNVQELARSLNRSDNVLPRNYKMSIPRTPSVNYDYAHKYMSPFENHSGPPQSTTSLGHFTTIDLSSQFTLDTSLTERVCIIYQPSNRSIYQILGLNLDTGLPLIATQTASPTYKFRAAGSESPLASIRPMRSGMKITNISENDTVSGLVKVLQQSSPLQYIFTSGATMETTTAFNTSVLESINNNHRTKEFSARQFQTTGEIVCAPCTYSSYNSYGSQFINIESIPNYQASMRAPINDMPINTILIVFEPTAVVQKYNIRLQTQTACRFATGSTIAQLATTQKLAADSKFIEMIHQKISAEPTLRFDVNN